MKGFKPIINAKSSVLILGTFPSQSSLKMNQYYANATNLFWPLMHAVLQNSDNEAAAKLWNSTSSYKDKKLYVLRKGVAVWDVLRTCERMTSADRDIQYEKVYNFKRFFGKYPKIKTVVFNGGGKGKYPRTQSAAGFYHSHVGFDDDHEFITVYSSSSEDRNKLDYDSLFLKKYDDWKIIRDHL